MTRRSHEKSLEILQRCDNLSPMIQSLITYTQSEITLNLNNRNATATSEAHLIGYFSKLSEIRNNANEVLGKGHGEKEANKHFAKFARRAKDHMPWNKLEKDMLSLQRVESEVSQLCSSLGGLEFIQQALSPFSPNHALATHQVQRVELCNELDLSGSHSIHLPIRERAQRTRNSARIKARSSTDRSSTARLSSNRSSEIRSSVIKSSIAKIPIHAPKRISRLQKQVQRERTITATEEAAKYGDLNLISYNILHAISARRMRGKPLPTTLQGLYSELCRSDRSPLVIFRQRYLKAEFHRRWVQIVDDTRISQRAFTSRRISERKVICAELGLDPGVVKPYEAARKQKQRSAIWLKLMGLFEDDLGDNAFVALCAVACQSYVLDILPGRAQNAFLNAIEARKKSLLPALRVLCTAFSYVLDKSPSLATQRIELKYKHKREGEGLEPISTVQELEFLFTSSSS